MDNDLTEQLSAIEALPLEQRAEAFAALYDRLVAELEQVDAPGSSA